MILDEAEFDQMLVAARDKKAAHVADVVEPLHAAHVDAQGKLETVRAELAAVRAVISEFENDPESDISGADYEAARLRADTLAVLVKRAEIEAKRASGAWQDAQRAGHLIGRSALLNFRAHFDRVAALMRSHYDSQFQKLL